MITKIGKYSINSIDYAADIAIVHKWDDNQASHSVGFGVKMAKEIIIALEEHIKFCEERRME